MFIEGQRKINREQRAHFRALQIGPRMTALQRFDEAQMAILNVLEAYKGKLSPSIIIHAIGKASSPNAVSTSLRSRLPPNIQY